MKPVVAILILNFNGVDDTCRAIDSLGSSHDIETVVYVLDNGSIKDEARSLRRIFPNVTILRSETNLGFSGGVNLLASTAVRDGATYLLLLNNDARFNNGSETIAKLLSVLIQSSSAAVGPLVLNDDGTPQSAGYHYTPWFPLSLPRKAGSRRRPTFLSGSCLLIRADVFVAVGGLDPDFFLYGEDVDLAMRLTRLGTRVTVCEDAFVFHARASSSKLLSNQYIYSVLRGNLICALKHSRWFHAPSVIGTYVMVSAGLICMAALNGNRTAWSAVFKAWSDFAARRWAGLDGRAMSRENEYPILPDTSALTP